MEINIDNCVEKRRMVVVNKKNKRRKCECRRRIKDIIRELIKDGLEYDMYENEEGTFVDVKYEQMEKMIKEREREGVLAWYVMDQMDIEKMVLEIVSERE